MKPRGGVPVLVVDDDPQIAQICVHFLQREGFPTDAAGTRADAVRKVAEGDVGIVLLDVRLPDGSGIDVLKEIKQSRPSTEVIMMTAHGSVDDVVECMKSGASDFVAKPFKRERLVAAVEQSYRVLSLQSEVDRLQTDLAKGFRFEGIIGQSRRMRELFDRIANAAQSDSTVLILGESGTGKDLVGRTVHFNGPRTKGPFIAVNCAALPGELIESELFGYKKGAFTGAMADTVGLFRAADGGTIFLDEVVEMPISTQSKLLRVLQERKVRPVGGTEEIPVNVRVICATNRELSKAVDQGDFRKDLYYRLTVLTLTIPPLRERKEDIPLLVDHFVRKFNAQFKKSIQGADPRAMEVLRSYRWEGNIRELENAIESGFALGKGPVLRVLDLPPHIVKASEGALAAAEGVTTLKESERILVEKAMKVSKGNKSKASRLLGITRKRLYNIIRRFKLGK
jgi:DNA-binding NtrC family response regulator